MNENNDLLNDDFLRDLVRKSSLESPSDGFVHKVMEQILPQPEIIPAKKPLIGYLKNIFGFGSIAAVLAVFFLTSDIQVLNWVPGKQFFVNSIFPSFDSFLNWLNQLSGNGKGFTIPLMILAASGLFFLIDRFLSYRNSVKNYRAA